MFTCERKKELFELSKIANQNAHEMSEKMNQKLHVTADYHIEMIHIDLHVIEFH
jgi:hypothetical protein